MNFLLILLSADIVATRYTTDICQCLGIKTKHFIKTRYIYFQVSKLIKEIFQIFLAKIIQNQYLWLKSIPVAKSLGKNSSYLLKKLNSKFKHKFYIFRNITEENYNE